MIVQQGVQHDSVIKIGETIRIGSRLNSYARLRLDTVKTAQAVLIQQVIDNPTTLATKRPVLVIPLVIGTRCATMKAQDGLTTPFSGGAAVFC